jgi:hypothetical protein
LVLRSLPGAPGGVTTASRTMIGFVSV